MRWGYLYYLTSLLAIPREGAYSVISYLLGRCQITWPTQSLRIWDDGVTAINAIVLRVKEMSSDNTMALFDPPACGKLYRRVRYRRREKSPKDMDRSDTYANT